MEPIYLATLYIRCEPSGGFGLRIGVRAINRGRIYANQLNCTLLSPETVRESINWDVEVIPFELIPESIRSQLAQTEFGVLVSVG